MDIVNRLGITALIFSVIGTFLLSMATVSGVTYCLTESDTITNCVGVVLIGVYLAIMVKLIPFIVRIVRNVVFKVRDNLQNLTPLLLIAALGTLAATTTGCVGCERIEPGNVGIEVNLTGDDKGVSKTALVSGRVWYNSWTTQVLEYPTYVQTAQWTATIGDSTSGTNEEITFNTKENLAVSADVSLSYAVERDKVADFYVKYRSDDLSRFTHSIMRNVARDAFNEIGGTYAVEDLMGMKKEEFLEAVKERVNHRLASVGVKIDQFGFIGALRPPKSVVDAINAKLTATQTAQKAENELRTAEAEAKKLVAKSEGEAKAQLARAKGAADSRIAIAEGEAKSNQLLNQTITPQLVEWRRLSIQEQTVNRWNGVRPMVEGAGTNMLMSLPQAK